MVLQFRLNRPNEFVFAYLTDMQKYASVHPVINKIDHIRGNSYLVYETLNLGILPYSFTYPVTVDHDESTKQVSYRATLLKWIAVDMKFQLATEGNMTNVKETIEIRAVQPLKFLMQKIFRKQHKLLFENIEKEAVQIEGFNP